MRGLIFQANTLSQRFELMFLSEFPDDADATEIGRIVRASRINNAAARLTGVMMFDGTLFCQYLEGPEQAVRRMATKIAVDSRNNRFRLLHQTSTETAQRFETWHVGVVAPDGVSPLRAFESTLGAEAVDHLMLLFRESRKFGINVV